MHDSSFSVRAAKIRRDNARFIAAGTAGSITYTLASLLMHPVETVRARIQADAHNFITLRAMCRTMNSKEGLMSYWRGASVTGVCASAGHFVYFFTYDKLKTTLNQKHNLSIERASFIASISAMWCQTFLANPLDLVKTRMQLGVRYANFIQGLKKIARSEGASPFLATYRAKLVFDAIQVGSTWSLYESLRSSIRRWCLKPDGQIDHKRYVMGSAATFFIASIVTTVIAIPFSTLMTRVQLEGIPFFVALRSLLRNEGASSLRKGWSARVILTLFYATIPMPIYEGIKLRLYSAYNLH
eukprot:TRINITY_DN13556_c0_g1_i1.p1 TRINITY_DN13556_c0_g1~~TRINITY_DN13556_c0_g1_i1.p1  ORF type:complete len:299 (+),score=27.28 TRINITY_DN13556_c0_g1_i1:349-1245(+)